MPSSIVRFRPTGPWRFGPDSGTRDRVDLILHSDSLYAAVTSAMLRLNSLDEWLQATAAHQNGKPAVCFSSMFPFQREHLFVTPPRSLWPPPPSTKIRYKSARFVPISIVQALVNEKNIDENRWIIDADCQCMIPSGEGPFRIGLRSAAAIDRLDPAAARPHTTACLEFGKDAGLWCMVVFSDKAARDRWQPKVKSAFRLLADSGIGGERSQGWGRSRDPEWQNASDLWPEPEAEKGYWLLSAYSPAESDNVDWKNGNYETFTRTGRIESTSNYGGLKSASLMLCEGSVLIAPSAPQGAAPNVAPDGFAHPVYRAGYAVTIPIPWRVKTAPPPRPEPAKQVEPPSAQPPSSQPEPEPPQTEPMLPNEPTTVPETTPVEPHIPTQPGPEPTPPQPSEPQHPNEPKTVPETTPPEPHTPTPQPGPEPTPPEPSKPDGKPEKPKFPNDPTLPGMRPAPVEPEPETKPVEPHTPTPQPRPEPAPPEPEQPNPQPSPQPKPVEPQPAAPEPSPKPVEPERPTTEPPKPQPAEPQPPTPEPTPKPTEPAPPKPEPEPEPIEPQRPEHEPVPDPIEPQTPQPEPDPEPLGPDIPGLPGLEPAIASSNTSIEGGGFEGGASSPRESVEAISTSTREGEP